VGRGTTVEIRLPLAAPPAWFVERIALESGATVVVLDDDRAIHATWDRLLAPFAEQRLTVLHFTEARTLQEWLPEHRDARFLGLIDYELLRQGTTGLDLIEQEGIARCAILVTSRYAEPAIVERATRLGLKIIPKQLVGLVPIVQSATAAPQGPRVLVVDDDEMIAWAWRKQQKRLGVAELRTFSSMEACEAAAPDYGTFDVAFVDLNVDGTSWSIADTTRHLKQRGVKRVFVATGDPDVPLGRCPDADGIAEEKVPKDLACYLGRIETQSHSLKS
jgi:DNA-binding NtrC family response regulator